MSEPSSRPGGARAGLVALTVLLLGCSLGANVWLGREVLDLRRAVASRSGGGTIVDTAKVYEGVVEWEPSLRVFVGSGSKVADKAKKDEEIFGSDSSIKLLDEHSFDDVLAGKAGKKHVFVNFFAPWCHWSQRLGPEYERLARKISDDALVVAVDCMAQSELCRRNGVMAFPTLRLYIDGARVMPDYKMDRTADAMSAFVFRQVAVRRASGVDSLRLVFAGEEDGEGIRAEGYGVSQSGSLDAGEGILEDESNQKGIPEAQIVSTKEGSDELEEAQPETRSNGGLYGPTSPVIQLSGDNFDRFKANHRVVFVNFYAPWCTHCKKMIPEFERLAFLAERAPRVMAAVDCMAQSELCRRERLLAFPTLRLYIDGVGVAPDYRMDRTAGAMGEYIAEQVEKNSAAAIYGTSVDSPYLLPTPVVRTRVHKVMGVDEKLPSESDRSDNRFSGSSQEENEEEEEDSNDADHIYVDAEEDSSEEFSSKDEGTNIIIEDEVRIFGPDSPVIYLSGDTFDSFIAENEVVFVDFHTTWCAFSGRMVPAFEQLAFQAEDSPHPFAVVAVDCTIDSKLCDSEKIVAYPTLRLFVNGVAVQPDYMMERTVPGMVNYVRETTRKVRANMKSNSITDIEPDRFEYLDNKEEFSQPEDASSDGISGDADDDFSTGGEFVVKTKEVDGLLHKFLRKSLAAMTSGEDLNADGDTTALEQ